MSAPIMELLNAPFDVYHIQTNTENRAAFHAPYSAIVPFWGIDEVKFDKLVKPWITAIITAIKKSDSCLGGLWGRVKTRLLLERTLPRTWLTGREPSCYPGGRVRRNMIMTVKAEGCDLV